MRNFHLTFDWHYLHKLGGDFSKYCGLLRIYELYDTKTLQKNCACSSNVNLFTTSFISIWILETLIDVKVNLLRKNGPIAIFQYIICHTEWINIVWNCFWSWNLLFFMSVQVNLCQKLLFLYNMGRKCCVQKSFWISKTISVHNMFSPCSKHVLSMEFSCIELVIQWIICRHIVG